jgi:hypothetical protein
MTEKIAIRDVSIMVNNLCNLTCSDCVGLALYDFLGTFDWNEWAHRYKKWSEILEPDWISVCGGEPYLHPQLELWFDNIRELWPSTHIEVMTNGTRLSKNIGLSRKFIQDGNACLRVSCHDISTFDKMKDELTVILSPWTDIEIEEVEHKMIFPGKGIYYSRNNKIVCKLQMVTEMVPPYHKTVENGIVYFEMNGDREESHNNCAWREAYTFQHGILYKCPPVTNYPEAKLQVGYEKAASDILDTYTGCDPFDTLNEINNFVKMLPESIPVCELCAFDKQKDPMAFNRQVTLDKNKKKKFRQFKIYQENT